MIDYCILWGFCFFKPFFWHFGDNSIIISLLLFRQKLLNRPRFPVLLIWFFSAVVLFGFVINYAILCPFIFRHNSFFFDKIRNYLWFCYFWLILLAMKDKPIATVLDYRGLLCSFYMYYRTLCLLGAHLYSSAAWL